MPLALLRSFTSSMRFIVALTTLLVISGCFVERDERRGRDTDVHSKSKAASLSQANARPKWRAHSSRPDPMDGSVFHYATSTSRPSTPPMTFIFEEVTATILVTCWAVEFRTSTANFRGNYSNGAFRYFTRWKFDENPPISVMMQKSDSYGEEIIYTHKTGSLLPGIRAGKSVLIEVPWYERGPVRFRFSLSGSSAAISDLKSRCRVWDH